MTCVLESRIDSSSRGLSDNPRNIEHRQPAEWKLLKLLIPPEDHSLTVPLPLLRELHLSVPQEYSAEWLCTKVATVLRARDAADCSLDSLTLYIPPADGDGDTKPDNGNVGQTNTRYVCKSHESPRTLENENYKVLEEQVLSYAPLNPPFKRQLRPQI